MIFLFDTNACIALIKGDPPQVRERFRRAVRAGDKVKVSTLALAELWFGAARSARPEENSKRILAFIAEMDAVPFDIEAARTAGSIRAELARKGAPIGAYDGLIAGHAICLGATLVTENLREFRRVDGLNCQNWVE